MWEIYVLGDAGYIASIMNALAMLANANIFLQLAAVGLLIGVILTVAQGLTDGGRINPGPILGSLIVILIMFSQTTNVTIINVRTGGAQIVSNVPFGPVVIGSLVSRMGKAVTETIELAFSTPGMSEFGFFTPIKALAKMREMSVDTAMMDANTDPLGNGTDIDFSLINYFKDCTAQALERKEKTITEMRANKTPLDFIRWDSAFVTTQIRIGGVISEPTCTLAYTTLRPIIENSYKTRLQSTVVKMMRSSKDELATGGSIDVNIINYAAQEISGGNASGGDLVLSSVLSRLFELGMIGRMETDRMWVKAATERDAINKRIESWQTEGSVFEHFMMPIMTFLEGLVFALAPFAALAIGLGSKGLQVAGTYITLAIWVQLWMPLMSIVNHFTTEIAMASLSNIDSISNTTGFPSWSSLNAIDSNLQTWLAVAGMLSSSVPFLAAAVLFGGGQLIGKMGSMVSGGGSAAGSAGISAPPVTNGAPAIKMNGGSSAEWSAPTGAMRAGASAVEPEYGLGTSRQQMAKEAKQSAVAARSELSTAVGAAYNKAETRQELAKQMSGMTLSEARSSGATGRLIAAEAEKQMKSGAMKGATAGQVMAQIAAGTPKNLPVSVGGSASWKANVSSEQSTSSGSEKSDTKQTEWNKKLESAFKADAAASEETVGSRTLSKTGGEEFKDARSRAITASRVEEEASQRAKSYNSGFSFSESNYADSKYAAAQRSAGGVAGLESKMAELNQQFGIQGDVDKLAAKMTAPGGGFMDTAEGKTKAKIAAQARILNGVSESANLDSKEQERGMRAFDREVGELYGLGFNGGGRMFENNEVAGGVDKSLREANAQATTIQIEAGEGSRNAGEVRGNKTVGDTDILGAGGEAERNMVDKADNLVNVGGRWDANTEQGRTPIEMLDREDVNGPTGKSMDQLATDSKNVFKEESTSVGGSVARAMSYAEDKAGDAIETLTGGDDAGENSLSQGDRKSRR